MNTQSPFDLGNLSALKPGDEVTTLDTEGNVAGRVFVVHSFYDNGVRVCKPGDVGKPAKVLGYWRHENRGGFPWAMHDQSVMRGYFSANPEHIARAKAAAEAARIAEEAKRAAFNKLLEQAAPIGCELGDGWDDEGESYSRSIARTLAERLTSEQIATLAGWLGLKS